MGTIIKLGMKIEKVQSIYTHRYLRNANGEKNAILHQISERGLDIK